MNWQLVGLPDVPDQRTARMAGAWFILGKGEWEAADTISVFGFTGWPAFYDVFRNADRTLRGLNASAIAVQVLPVPAIQWVAAVRSSGTAVIGDRNVWIQQTNDVAGSEEPQAGRLIVHSVFIGQMSRSASQTMSPDSANSIYQGFVAALLRLASRRWHSPVPRCSNTN